MSITETLQQLEREINEYAKEHTLVKGKKFKDSLRKEFSKNALQISLVNAVISVIDISLNEEKNRQRLSSRFETIPRRFPFPNANDDLDKLIYGRFTLGYASMADGRKANRTAAGVARTAGASKYFNFALKKAQMKELNGANFKLLCAAGFPQATHEYLYTHELRSKISDALLIAECERLLTEQGY